MSATTTDGDTLTVTVNKRDYDVPNTISTRSEFLEAVGYTGREYRVYRIDGCEETKLTGEIFVFDDGDEFVIIPKYINGG